MAMVKGWWILLTSIGTQLALAMEAFRTVREGRQKPDCDLTNLSKGLLAASQEARHDNFRLFLVYSGKAYIPEPLLTSCTTAFMSPDWTLQSQLAQALSLVCVGSSFFIVPSNMFCSCPMI
jgi:hypothetical protein